MSFVLRTYLESRFEYVIFSSVVLTDGPITDGILEAIGRDDYDLLFFMLSCSREELKARSAGRDGVVSPEVRFEEAARAQDVIHIDTTGLSSDAVAEIVLRMVNDPKGAGLVPAPRGGIREWKRPQA